MNFAKASMAAWKSGLLLAVTLGLGACSGGGDGSTGALLNGGSGGGSGGSGAGATLVITGPANETSGGVNVRADSETPGFKVTLKNASGAAIGNKFVGIKVSSPVSNGGSISGKVGASDNEGGAQTNAAGVGTFTYIAPETVTAKRTIVLTATFDESETDTVEPVTATFNLSVNPPPKGKISIVHPEGTSGNVRMESGETDEDFTAVLVTADEFEEPLPDAVVTFALSGCTGGSGGAINAPVNAPGSTTANTDEAGRINFGFSAPRDLLAAATCTITARSTVNASTTTTSFNVGVNKAPAPIVTINGFTTLQNGVENEGFSARVALADGSALQTPPCISISADRGATIKVPASVQSCTGGFLAETQPVPFSVTPPTTVTATTRITITARATVNAQTGSKTFSTVVEPDVFRFTAPEENTAIPVGLESAQPVTFQWTTDPDGPQGPQPGVGSGTLTLSGANAKTFFIVNGRPLDPGVPATVEFTTDSNGDFSQTIAIASNDAGQNTITLTQSGTTSRTATKLVQFVQRASPSEIKSLRLTVAPAVVSCFPNSARFSTLTVDAENLAGDPAGSVDIDFVVIDPKDPAIDNVFPTTQTTGTNGKANSSFEAGRTAGTVTVRAQVQNNPSVFSERPITISQPAAASGGSACTTP